MGEIVQLMPPDAHYALFPDGSKYLLAWALIRDEGSTPTTRVEGLVLVDGNVVVAREVDGFGGYGQVQR